MIWIILVCVGVLCIPVVAGFLVGLWQKRDHLREIRRAKREAKREEIRAYFERRDQHWREVRARDAALERQARQQAWVELNKP